MTDEGRKQKGKPARLHRTVDIPQADRLESVRRLAEAVREGISNRSAVRELLKVDPRHHAYYSRAAVILGVIIEAPGGDLSLTEVGRSILAAVPGSPEERQAFRRAIELAPSLRPYSTFFDGVDVPLSVIAQRVQAATGLAATTAERRARTLLQWKRYVEGSPPALRVPGHLQLPDLTARMRTEVELHNAKAKQLYLEWLHTIPPSEFERLIAELAKAMGLIDVSVTGRSGDGGVDVRARAPPKWSSRPGRVAIQAKRHIKPVGADVVDRMAGVLARERCAQAIVITTSEFTRAALRAAEEHDERLELVTGSELVERLVQHAVGLRRGDFGEIIIARDRDDDR